MLRMIIAVKPALLGTSLGAVLGNSYEITYCDDAPGSVWEGDVAIVSGTGRDDVKADTVIALPDVEGNAGIGLVWRGDDAVPTPLQISSLADLLQAVALARA